MELFDQINSHKYLYLTDISEPDINILRLVIEEARASGEPENLNISGVIIKDCQPIVSTEECFAYEIRFHRYIAYSIRNESYVSGDEAEEYSGRLLCIYSKSAFLDYVRASTFASDDYPGLYKHYGINCLDHIVDVASVDEPTVQIIRGKETPNPKSDASQPVAAEAAKRVSNQYRSTVRSPAEQER